MSLRAEAPMTPEQARLKNPLQLAHIGDTVWDLLVRSELLWAGMNLRHMHQGATARVNAGAQARTLEALLPLLTEEERDIVRRGRNASPHHPIPKNQSGEDYQAATALEALMGYLYITGQDGRVLALYRAAQEAQHA